MWSENLDVACVGSEKTRLWRSVCCIFVPRLWSLSFMTGVPCKSGLMTEDV